MKNIKIADLLDISHKAGLKIMEVYESSDFEVDMKADDSPLTKADRLAHKEIVENLSKLYPDIPIVSEESVGMSYEKRKDWKTFFLVDPLDGTKEFIKENGEFTVNIAVIDNHKAVMGVVYAPVLDTYYYSDGQKSFKMKGNEQNELPIKTVSDKIKVVASRSHLNDETKAYVEKLSGDVDFVSMGSSLKLCLVAEGEAQVYPRFAPTSEWDTAAAHAVVKTAGGDVYQIPSKEEVVYNKEDILNPYFLVTRENKYLEML